MFLFSHEFSVFSSENFKFYVKSWTLERMGPLMEHTNNAIVYTRVILPVKFACKAELILMHSLG